MEPMPFSARFTRRWRQVGVGVVIVALVAAACLYLGALPARGF